MRIERTQWDPAQNALEESLFHTANGYLGVRACPEEGRPRAYPASAGPTSTPFTM